MSNKLKEGMVTISHETENVNKEIKPIFKKNQMETLQFKMYNNHNETFTRWLHHQISVGKRRNQQIEDRSRDQVTLRAETKKKNEK